MATAVDEKFFYACQKMSDWLTKATGRTDFTPDWFRHPRDQRLPRHWLTSCEATNAVAKPTAKKYQERTYSLNA